MSRNRTWPDLHLGNLCKRRLKCTYKFCFQLRLNFFPVILLCKITADICIKQQRIYNFIRIYSIAAHRYINIQSDISVYHSERDGIGCSKLVSYQLFCIKIIYSLVFSRISSIGKTLFHCFKGLFDSFTEPACKNTGFCRGIISKFSRFCADFNNFALLHDDHALAICYRDSRTIGNDIITASFVRGTSPYPFLPLHGKNFIINCLTVKKFFPLIRQCAACCSCSCFN